MVRLILLFILIVIVARAFWRVVDNVVRAASGHPPDGRGGAGGRPRQAAKMVRDPVCGTFVLPDHSVSLTTGRERVYFCSDACRDAYRTRTA